MDDKYHHNQIKSVLEHSKKIRILDKSILLIIIFLLFFAIYNYSLQDPNIASIEQIDDRYEEVGEDFLENILQAKNSVISGVNNENQYYEISSEKSWNTIHNENILNMSGIKTSLILKEDYPINIVGDKATYDNEKKYLKLEDNIEIRSDKSILVFIKNVFIDLKKNKIMSPSPVLVKFNDLCIQSETFEINDNGNKIKFNNGVILIIGKQSKCLEI
jgi:hypothetical protein